MEEKAMENRHDLMDFISGGPAAYRILVLDGSKYLKKLRELFPNAELYGMTPYEEAAESPFYEGLDIHWTVGDYRRIGLPYELRFFDMVLAESCLECLWDSYETLMDIGRHIKETGHFLGMFSNIRYWRILEGLQQGKFPVRDRHLYAKSEVVRMLNDALFKEIFFVPSELCEEEAEKMHSFETLGFENTGDDLLVKTWMFKASCSKASVAVLKEFYTPEVRKCLSRLLHRIEYDVEREKALESLWKLCEEQMIFPDYLSDFLEETVIAKVETRNILRASARENQIEMMMEL